MSGHLRESRGALRIIAPVVLNRVIIVAAVISAIVGTGAARAASAGGASQTAPASGAAHPEFAGSAPAAAQSLSAHLRASDTSPLQLHGVLFDASASTGPIHSYVFRYGDGIVEQSYQPLALHGYRNPGIYHATVIVLDAAGRQATSAALRIHVRDGIPPTVSIDSPRVGQRMRLSPAGALLKGAVSDSDGVSRVQLAIQLLSSKRQFATHGLCIWYDAHQWLVLSGCGAPFFFNARVSRGHWSFRIGSAALIPAGTYAIRVRAIDRTGNISHYYSIRLRTILPFELTR